MTTTCTQETWRAPDGEVFSYSVWEADLPVGVVVAVHGLSGAALDYEPLGRHLAPLGVTTMALELRGQGNDPQEKRRGDLEEIEEWFADLRVFFALARERYPGVRVFCYGESMGAALLTRFLAQAEEVDRPAGLILASPVVALPVKTTWWQELVFGFFLWTAARRRIDVRRFTRKNEAPKYVTRDEAHRKWFETAPHRLHRFTVRFFRCLRELIAGCFAAAPRVRAPVLVIYAAHDVFILPAKVEEFFGLLGSEDKEIRFFPEAYHLLLHDLNWEQALGVIEGWLLARLPGRVGSLR